MQMDFSSPKFFLPNYLQSGPYSPNFFTIKIFYYMIATFCSAKIIASYLPNYNAAYLSKSNGCFLKEVANA